MLFNNLKILILLFFAVSIAKSEGIELSAKDITIKTDSLCAFHAVSEYSMMINNTEYLIRSNGDNNSVDLFNLTTLKFERRINLPFYFEAFYLKSLDSVYAIENEINVLSLFDGKGKLLQKTNFDNSFGDSLTKYVVYASNNNLLSLADGRFVFKITANVRVPEYYSYPTIGIYDIASQKLIKTASYPQFMQKRDIWLSFDPNYCINDKNEIVNSFDVEHNLNIFDNYGRLRWSVDAKSKYIEQFEPIQKDKSYNASYSQEYEVTRNRYSGLFYDKFRDLYYRVAVHSQKHINDDGTVNQYGSNPWSIIVMDSEFRIIKEIEMERDMYQISSMVVVRNGLLIQKNDEKTKSEDDLEYTLFKIEVK